MCVSVFFSCESNEKEHLAPVKSLSTEEYAKLKTGDIIAKCGYGTISNAIVKIMKEKVKISHCGFVQKSGDSLWVIHSVAKEASDADGVQSISIQKFLNDTKPGTLYVVRLKSDSATIAKVNEKAISYLQCRTPFDYDFDNNNTDKLYCSELVHQSIVAATGTEMLKKGVVQNKEIILFNSLLDSSRFETIIHK